MLRGRKRVNVFTSSRVNVFFRGGSNKKSIVMGCREGWCISDILGLCWVIVVVSGVVVVLRLCWGICMKGGVTASCCCCGGCVRASGRGGGCGMGGMLALRDGVLLFIEGEI